MNRPWTPGVSASSSADPRSIRSGLIAQIACTLVAIAVVHSDNRLASTIAMAAFSTAVGASALLILSHDRPFLGQISVGPEPLLQVMPQEDVNKPG
ncbi:MAG TPA: hypothetical protein VGY52_09710 [Roseiarcus sp.]|nr:hypothetical protein [Roseiarcus sp.]